jgi:transposase
LLADIYGADAPSDDTCEKWFKQFRNFSLSNNERGKPPKKFDNQELLEFLEEDPCQTLQEFSAALHVDASTVFSRLLHLMGMVQKQGSWVPHKLKERDIE